jgi:hypothetical protein
MTIIEDECPCCETELEINTYRWNTTTICPSCSNVLLVQYDICYDEDSNEEWDFWWALPIHETIYSDYLPKLDLVDSKIK